MQLYVCLTQGNTPFICLIPLEASDGKMNTWHKSGHATMEVAKENWIRRQSDKTNGCYTLQRSIEGVCPEPRWPKMDLEDMMDLAFGTDLYVKGVNHPILKTLGHQFPEVA